MNKFVIWLPVTVKFVTDNFGDKYTQKRKQKNLRWIFYLVNIHSLRFLIQKLSSISFIFILNRLRMTTEFRVKFTV